MDFITFICIITLYCFSSILINISSIFVAKRIGVHELFFVKKQLIFLPVSFMLALTFSNIQVSKILKTSIVFVVLIILCLSLTILYGSQIKGSRRWLNVFGFAMQPSEFLRPFLWIVTSFIISRKSYCENFPVLTVVGILYLVISILILLQPDIGTLMLLYSVLSVQLFVAGISVYLVCIIIFTIVVILAVLYLILPHVRYRVDSFLWESGNYQVTKSLQAFYQGGLYGVGPGEGVVKKVLPDSHTDFVLSVIAEEFGGITAVVVCLIFCILVVRSMYIILNDTNLFRKLTVTGISVQLWLQSFINLGVAVHILPTKGMTLPILSYGGSSVISIGILFGILLAFTKNNLLNDKFTLNKYNIN